MASYRAFHIPQKKIGMMPQHGYINKTNYSADAIRWMDFVSFTSGDAIKHGNNGTGEVKIAELSVDGFCETTQTVYQYHVSYYDFIFY